MNIDQLIDDILRREGSRYVNHPADRGGPTRYGITQTTLDQVHALNMPVMTAHVKDLTENEARLIYYYLYLLEPRFDQIQDEKLRGLIVDCGVNHGTTRAARWLQRAAKVTQDGRVGPITLLAVNGQNALKLYLDVLATRVRFYGKIVTHDARVRGRTEDQALNAHGWANRAAEFIDQAL